MVSHGFVRQCKRALSYAIVLAGTQQEGQKFTSMKN